MIFSSIANKHKFYYIFHFSRGQYQPTQTVWESDEIHEQIVF
jgi:hypothetical protein